jgi:hypothetical protein
MHLSKLKYLILSILVFSACNAPKNCIKVTNAPDVLLLPVIALDSSAPVLYRGEFEVLKYKFSGLIAFRKMPENKETRVVFLTEVGIRVMEFTFRDGKIKNTYCIQTVQRKSIIRFISSFLQMLLEYPDYHSLCLSKTDTKRDYFCKLKKGYASYEFTGDSRTHMLMYKGNRKYTDGSYVVSSSLPDTILTVMKFKTQIQLKRVNNAFK